MLQLVEPVLDTGAPRATAFAGADLNVTPLDDFSAPEGEPDRVAIAVSHPPSWRKATADCEALPLPRPASMHKLVP